ncbi:MAG: tetratricopeptide repeat protein [Prevotella sp.]|nr:tetratricopeptide repeat protein [Bacteroides sp.]MCM1366562.1 tetratricopeptide repeat protein [Prevotella sp.]MCM1436872.1 tetratricopeptide repeat protein [Prevotella sp.]
MGRLSKNISSIGIAVAFVAMASLVVLFSACSPKKNTAASRNWQAFNTRYNVFYNGSEHYIQTLKDMESKYEDDYTRTLLTHPAQARSDNKLPQPSGDFKRTIEKMQKAIQLHSIKKKPVKRGSSKKEKEFRARDEFNPFLHNAWLMLGKSQFNGGDYLGAASTFFYISKHFTWLPAVVTEAQLWEAYSYSTMNWLYEAENILRKVKEKSLTSKSLRYMYNLVQSDYLVRSERYKEAVPYLQKAAAASHGSQKNRLYFLLGQVCERLGEKTQAYDAFRKAGSGVSTAYRTKFNARIKQSEVFTGKNIKSEVNALRAMARYQRNKEFLDQIYYAIGNLYLAHKDTSKAKENYILAVEKSTRNGIDKALANLALGAIYFDEGDYVKAQPCYSEAIPMISNNYPNYKVLKNRSDVLDQLATYSGNVQLQDSLLTLSKLPEDKKLEVCQRLADELKKKEKEEAEAARREEYLADQAANSQQTADPNAPQQFQLNTDKSWYFYNATTKNAGKTEFQRRWGVRKLEDDWRRRNKTSYSMDDVASDASNEVAPNDSVQATQLSEEDKEKINKETDPHYAEYYLKQIPSTEEEIANSNEIIEDGLYNMAVILKDRLEDYPAARKEFYELDTRYPDNKFRLDAYYNLYLMAVRENNEEQAEKWRQKILEDFPDSPYGTAMRDPNYFEHLRQMHARQEKMYQEAYDAYLDNDNKIVHSLTDEMEKDYPLSEILPKFVFIDALSYITEQKYDKFEERLEYLLEKWPDTDMTDLAGGILRRLKQGMTPQSGVNNTRGMLWSMRLTNDSSMMEGADGQPVAFERDPMKPQYLVLAFNRDSINANQVLYDVARFNFSSFTVRDFDLEPMAFGNMGLLVIKGFENQKELDRYRDIMANSPLKLPEGVRLIPISKANFELLLSQGRSFDEYFQFRDQEPEPPLPEDVIKNEGDGENPPEESSEIENTEINSGEETKSEAEQESQP